MNGQKMKSALRIIGIVIGILIAVFIFLGITVSRSFGPIVAGKVEEGMRLQPQEIRMAISGYRQDHNGSLPASLDELVPNYLPRIPELWRVRKYGHPETDKVLLLHSKELHDSGNWVYVRNSNATEDGTVYIDCSHQDSKGKTWNEY